MVNGARRFLRIGVRVLPPGGSVLRRRGRGGGSAEPLPLPLAMIVFAVEYCINRAKNCP